MKHPAENKALPALNSFDWTTGSWSGSADTPARAQICIAGDWAPIRAFDPLIRQEPKAVYTDLLPLLSSADLSVVNLEAPLSDQGSEVWKSGAVFKGVEDHIQGLAAVPFGAVTLANNHVFDYGLNAFHDTVAVLDRNGIQRVGAGDSIEEASAPLVMDVNGVTIAIVNFSEGEDLTDAGKGPGVFGWDIPRVTGIVAGLRNQVDVIIAVSHCGIEYIPFPPPYVVSAFKAVAEAGADIVIGHHPHVPQGIGFHGGVPLCYSLGNFVFYQDTPLVWRKLGYAVRAGVSGDGLASLEVVPYQIHDSGVSLLKGLRLETFFRRLKEISLPLDTDQGIQDAWHGFLHHYGRQGFTDEVARIMAMLESQPEKGAAMFRNRLTTRQHFHHWQDTMTRIMSGTLESSPDWARGLAREWLTRTCPIEEAFDA